MNYELIKAADGVYWTKFDSGYDLSMTYLRYQEHYENSSERFRGKAFTILDFMEYYARNFGNGVFSYPQDFSGYNLPSHIIESVIGTGIPDPNKYDTEMLKIHHQITDRRYYLIGSCGENIDPHEFAHATYFINGAYANEMDALVKGMDNKAYDQMCNFLINLGYGENVFDDEMQAYLSTSYKFGIKGNKKDVDWQKASAPFKAVYRKYNGDNKMLERYWKEIG